MRSLVEPALTRWDYGYREGEAPPIRAFSAACRNWTRPLNVSEPVGGVLHRSRHTIGFALRLNEGRPIRIDAPPNAKNLDALTAAFQVYPQKLVNVRVKERKPLEELPEVCDEIRAVEASLGDAGRVLVRFSGTEPLARVMVEGPDKARVVEFADRIAGKIRSALGGVTT